MTTYNLIKQGNDYHVEGLRDEWNASGNVMLICHYPSGDCDAVSRNDANMHRALYDLYQVNDDLKDGDAFAIRGRIAYRCQGVHVVRA